MQVPHYYDVVNYIRVATYMSIVWSELIFVVLSFHPGTDGNDLLAMSDLSKRLSIICWAGMAPMFALGWFAAWLRLRYYHHTVLDKFR